MYNLKKKITSNKKSNNMILEHIKNEFKLELAQIDDFIKTNIATNVDLINNISTYLTLHSGKRIRSLIHLLFSKISSNHNNNSNITTASAIELIHTATLLHDDVVDTSEKRRGNLTVNTVWGNKEAILVGDFLYTKSFKMMVETKNINILKLMAHTTNIMSEGEIKQLIHRNNLDITEFEYLDIIKCKTAELFAASSLSSLILSNKSANNLHNAYIFGIHLGLAYQLIDDMLDYFTTDEKFGKNIYDDILCGTLTLPIIILMKENANTKKHILEIILTKSQKNLITIKNLVIKSNALDYTFNLALYHIDKAKKALSNFERSKFLDLTMQLVDFIIQRKY